MQGARARFRDAVLLAELNNLRVRANAGQPFDPLFFCFFNDEPTELVRASSSAEALAQMQGLFRSSPAQGQTDITRALQVAFESIRSARGRDPYLERAKVVLVTDGEDRIRMDEVRASRSSTGALKIALSFISLGEENTDLRTLAEEQRAAGERAFYYHLTDYEIGAVRTEFDRRFRTLLPPELAAEPGALEQLKPRLDALEALARAQPVAPAPPSTVSFDTLFPIAPTAVNDPASAEEVERIRDILSVLAEIAPLSLPENRAQDVVALLLHLLQTYGLTLTRYLAALARAIEGDEVSAVRAREVLRRLRLLARPLT
jgi:hypothetical protein